MSVDGTDCMIFEPVPFSAHLYSQKSKGPGLRYEVAVSIDGGEICGVNEPLPCCTFTYLVLFRRYVKGQIAPNEHVVSDKSYPGNKCVSR